ncbi:unnamed protein product [Gongylonema pulchrum]|uniref:Ig-like domain-containing protein n=1 Tax=Gongylonema pulchrum TaxID=637853 RepID=A0A183D5Z2_9BILA|nr:unnamed protein product [Gongylonema pulchrum]
MGFLFFLRRGSAIAVVIIFAAVITLIDARGGRRAGKGKGKSNLQFAQVAEFSLYYEKLLGEDMLWSKLEIDPATMGDQGIYACVANNEHGVMAKNFKAEFTY